MDCVIEHNNYIDHNVITAIRGSFCSSFHLIATWNGLSV